MNDDEFYTATEAAFRRLPQDDPATLAIGVVLAYARMLRKNDRHGVIDVSVFRSLRHVLCGINDLITATTHYARDVAAIKQHDANPFPTRKRNSDDC